MENLLGAIDDFLPLDQIGHGNVQHRAGPVRLRGADAWNFLQPRQQRREQMAAADAAHQRAFEFFDAKQNVVLGAIFRQRLHLDVAIKHFSAFRLIKNPSLSQRRPLG